MSTIESLAVAQTTDSDKSEKPKLTRAELEAELDRLRRRETLFAATEQVARIGHYEWNYELDRLESCSEEYAHIFNMTVDEVLVSQESWAKRLQLIHRDDLERYKTACEALRQTKSLDVEFRVQLANDQIKHLREIGVVVTDDDGLERGTFGILQDISEQVRHERDLEYRDEMARQAESITDIGHFIYDEANGKYLYLSDGFARIHGVTVDEYLDRLINVEDDIADIHPDDRENVAQIYRDFVASGEDCALEYRLIRADGKIRWIREMGKANRIKDGKVTHTIGVLQDITESIRHEQELLYKDALANQAEAITDIGHFIFDEIKQEYLFISPGLVSIYDREVEELSGRVVPWKRDLELIHVDDRERVQKVYDEFLARGDEWQVDYRLVRADGEVRWVHEMGKAHLINHGIPEQTIGVLQDITRQKSAEQEIINARDTLEQQVVTRTKELANTVKQLQEEIEEREKIAAELAFLANHDALTGLPSLRLCKDRLDQSLAEARRNRQMSAVMFLDLDGFKEVNDSYGHELGDLVLKATADRIRDEIRETDTVARIGGDEFVIILSSLPEIAIAERIATSLIEQISKTIYIEQIEVSISSSIGISIYPENGTTAEELIREADRAMYQVKHQGKNNFGFIQMDKNSEPAS